MSDVSGRDSNPDDGLHVTEFEDEPEWITIRVRKGALKTDQQREAAVQRAIEILNGDSSARGVNIEPIEG